MKRKLVYKGDRHFHVLFPVDVIVKNGTEVVVDTKEAAEQLMELGFAEVATGKEEIEKKDTKKKESEK